MPREWVGVWDCGLPAEAFWALRSDLGFDRFFCRLDGHQYTSIKDDRTTTPGRIDREYKLCSSENPVPKILRGVLPKMDEYSFRIVCSFHTHQFDEAHPYEYQTFFPVLADRITVTGIQWCEPVSSTSCRLHCRVNVGVRVVAVGGAAEKALEASMRDAYQQLADRAVMYVEQQQRTNGAQQRSNGAQVRRPPPSLMNGRGGLSALSDLAALAEEARVTTPAQRTPTTTTPLSKATPTRQQPPPLLQPTMTTTPSAAASSSTAVRAAASSLSELEKKREEEESPLSVAMVHLIHCLAPNVGATLDVGANAEVREAQMMQDFQAMRSQLVAANKALAKAQAEVAELTASLQASILSRKTQAEKGIALERELAEQRSAAAAASSSVEVDEDEVAALRASLKARDLEISTLSRHLQAERAARAREKAAAAAAAAAMVAKPATPTLPLPSSGGATNGHSNGHHYSPPPRHHAPPPSLPAGYIAE